MNRPLVLRWVPGTSSILAIGSLGRPKQRRGCAGRNPAISGGSGRRRRGPHWGNARGGQKVPRGGLIGVGGGRNRRAGGAQGVTAVAAAGGGTPVGWGGGGGVGEDQ